MTSPELCPYVLYIKSIFPYQYCQYFACNHLNLLVGCQLGNQTCCTKSILFFAKKAVGHMTFGSHLTG